MTELVSDKQSPRIIRIAKPNLGNPYFLEIDQKLTKNKFTSKLLIASELTNSNLVEDMIRNNIDLIPILDYKLDF